MEIGKGLMGRVPFLLLGMGLFLERVGIFLTEKD